MPPFQMFVICLAGLGAGAINALVGSGTLITFPTLVALGYPPVTATMSNATGLVAGSVSGTWGYRAELRGQWDRLRWQLPASLAGAAVGAYLLLHLPEKVFAEIVPVLLVLALVLVVIGPRIQAWTARRAEEAGRSPEHVSPRRMAALVFGTFAVGVYGGYFTAAQGILLATLIRAAVMTALDSPDDARRLPP
ncbi:sulfite exporter TauE/SafE family protein, partial [Mycobacterium colombiense]|uniref:sulfite exporter TauE/SafE family protein n=1 Tax=Mycobacterium colombiense TaxID=339268 RepID=UPI00094A10F0